MRKHLFTALTVAALAAGATSTAATGQYQTISLDAASGDSSVAGHAQLDVTRAHGGFRIRGAVTSFSGCVELKAVEMHLGMYWGGDQIVRVCGTGHRAAVDAFTHHSDVVLTADIGPGYDSPITTLTGTGG
ncbi:hypothetical protein [Streptacidiphilus jiangxiensis]|uniref:Uncharacterized protein n=1 Tax=Streptacidiphilus jiangxiensis TaxID=235985 RepID=A0A1H8AX84_STRJI|nr:hypothetical protein [Streptacidiphilus jiangxiensis]SEM75096.1 hypothetical protein SAMN05414137_1529 [Streptacidiphilus jiangxiensis]